MKIRTILVAAAITVGLAAPNAFARPPLYAGCDSGVVMFFTVGGSPQTAPNAGAASCLAGDLSGQHIEYFPVPPGATGVRGRQTDGGQVGTLWNWHISGLGTNTVGQIQSAVSGTLGGSVVDTPVVALNPTALGLITTIFNMHGAPENFMIQYSTVDYDLASFVGTAN